MRIVLYSRRAHSKRESRQRGAVNMTRLYILKRKTIVEKRGVRHSDVIMNMIRTYTRRVSTQRPHGEPVYFDIF